MDQYKKDKTKNIKTLLRLFPYLEDRTKATMLQIDKESIYYISVREYADKISNIIKEHLVKLRIDIGNSVISDGTAGVGGDTISFGKRFRKVYAIEQDSTRVQYLQNNIDVYGMSSKIEVINKDSLDVLAKIDDHDVVYLDPPWGGKDYKDYKSLQLKLSNIKIEILCNRLMDDKIMKKIPSIIVLKLPINYDLKYLYKTVESEKIYLYNLKKMYIVVIVA